MKESWLFEDMALFAAAGALTPLGEVRLRKEIEERCAYWGKLLVTQCSLLRRRLTAIAKETGGEVELGIWRHRRWGSRDCWPYAAIRVMDGGRLVSGQVLIPQAIECRYFLRHKLALRGRKPEFRRGFEFIRNLVPVMHELHAPPTKPGVQERVVVQPDDLPRNPHHIDVRMGDCYLFDLTFAHSPVVVCDGLPLGTAVRFGGIEEMIDAVRCRIVFGMLPSA